MTESVPKKPNIAEISPHLICALCGGYLIDATTIVECLHSFCKTCIVRYLESSKYCPICEVLVHKTRPLQNIRLDQTLQNIVYKLVPGLFQSEMKRRREFYKGHPTVRSAKSRQDQQRDRTIFSADEQFSISLEFCHDGRVRKPSGSRRSRRNSKPNGPDRRYLLCPASTTVALLKKFMKLKLALPDPFKVDVFHGEGPLRDHYSLMDIAYIYNWKREGVLQLYYSVFKPVEPCPKVTITEVKSETTMDVTIDAQQKVDEDRPSSLFSKASLLSRHSMDESLHHDLSPLELIATVANDISCLQEGRGIKRKSEASSLYENEDENNSDSQLRKSIDHAIDICSNSPKPISTSNKLENKEVFSAQARSLQSFQHLKPPPSTHSSILSQSTHNRPNPTRPLTSTTATTDNRVPSPLYHTATQSNNNRSTVITKVETKDKPKKTDTASQCDPRPKKPKCDSSNSRPSSHSKAQNKTEVSKTVTKPVDTSSSKVNNKSDGQAKSSTKSTDNKFSDSSKAVCKPSDTQVSSKTAENMKTSIKTGESTKIASKTLESTKTGSKSLESTKTVSKALESTKTVNKALESTKSGSKSLESTKIGSKAIESTKIGSKTLESTKTGSKTGESTKTGSKTGESTKTGSKTGESTKTGSKLVEPLKTGSKIVNTKSGIKTPESTKTGIKLVEPVKAGNRIEHIKNGSKTVDCVKTVTETTDSAKSVLKTQDSSKTFINLNKSINNKDSSIHSIPNVQNDRNCERNSFGSSKTADKVKSNGAATVTTGSNPTALKSDNVAKLEPFRTEKQIHWNVDLKSHTKVEIKVEPSEQKSISRNESASVKTSKDDTKDSIALTKLGKDEVKSSVSKLTDEIKPITQVNGHASHEELKQQKTTPHVVDTNSGVK